MESGNDAEHPTQPPVSRSRVEQDFIIGFESIGTPEFFRNVEATFSEDCVLVCNCPRTMVQLGGAHHGIHAALRALRSFFVEFEVFATSVDDIVLDGAHVIVDYNMSLRHVGTSRAGVFKGINRYMLDANRKVVKCDIFLDIASLAVIGDMLDHLAETARGFDLLRRPKPDA